MDRIMSKSSSKVVAAMFVAATLSPLLSPLISSALAASPYISKVYEFQPAPGQFVNTLPEWTPGMGVEDIRVEAERSLAGSARPGMVCLGAFGGYVVFGFDHPLVNLSGEYDLKIYGNAIISDKGRRGGSCEPGTVWVSVDENSNGIPDDRWYQLAGSEYSNPSTIHNFSIVYHRPSPDHQAVPSSTDRSIRDTEYILWESDSPARPSGYIQANTFHRQNYWPEWIDSDKLEFAGTLLPDNAIDTNGKGTSWTLLAFGEGYVDNLPDAEDSGLKLDWAVDEEGRHVDLQAVDFIKVQSAMLQNCGWLGETSTEVCGAEDLHPEALAQSTSVPYHSSDVECRLCGGVLQLRASAGDSAEILSPEGVSLFCTLCSGEWESIDISGMPHGLYIVRLGQFSKKIFF